MGGGGGSHGRGGNTIGEMGCQSRFFRIPPAVVPPPTPHCPPSLRSTPLPIDPAHGPCYTSRSSTYDHKHTNNKLKQLPLECQTMEDGSISRARKHFFNLRSATVECIWMYACLYERNEMYCDETTKATNFPFGTNIGLPPLKLYFNTIKWMNNALIKPQQRNMRTSHTFTSTVLN
jgi:hypothetical protein